LNKFNAVANKYPSTLPGKQARYYAALCLEDLEQQNQALEDLKKLRPAGTRAGQHGPISNGRDLFAPPASPMRQPVVPRVGEKHFGVRSAAVALLELANVLRQSNRKQPPTLYQQG